MEPLNNGPPREPSNIGEMCRALLNFSFEVKHYDADTISKAREYVSLMSDDAVQNTLLSLLDAFATDIETVQQKITEKVQGVYDELMAEYAKMSKAHQAEMEKADKAHNAEMDGFRAKMTAIMKAFDGLLEQRNETLDVARDAKRCMAALQTRNEFLQERVEKHEQYIKILEGQRNSDRLAAGNAAARALSLLDILELTQKENRRQADEFDEAQKQLSDGLLESLQREKRYQILLEARHLDDIISDRPPKPENA